MRIKVSRVRQLIKEEIGSYEGDQAVRFIVQAADKLARAQTILANAEDPLVDDVNKALVNIVKLQKKMQKELFGPGDEH